MVTEIAVITIDSHMTGAFEEAVQKGVEIFRAANGCHGMALERVVGDASRYRLLVKWDTIEHHQPRFWESPGFGQWRTLVAHFFVATPVLEYSETVAVYF